METLLSAKPWQLFLFAFGIPWLLMFFIVGFGFSDLESLIKANPAPEDQLVIMSEFMSKAMKGILPLTILSAAVSYGWMYAINQRISPMAYKEHSSNPFVGTAIICIFLFSLANTFLSGYLYDNMEGLVGDSSSAAQLESEFAGTYSLSLILSIANFGLLLFISYQLSKLVKGAELQRALKPEDFTGFFFAFLFPFIGIWFIQPTVNKLHEEGPGGRNDLEKSVLLD